MPERQGRRCWHHAWRAILRGTASPLVIALLCPPLAAVAEVVTDGRLGPRATLPGLDVEIGAGLGQIRGQNLFHSFQRFDVETGGSATFTGPDGLENVVARVTGGERSDIDGALRSTIPGADLYLLNPAGIVFGPNARLDVRGAFHASTAGELRFADGAAFSALDPAGSSLSVAEPRAFGFLGSPPGAITVDRGVLEVPPGAALSLVGGDVAVAGTGADGAGIVRAEAGRVTLAGAGPAASVSVASGEVQGDASARVRVRVGDGALVTSSGDGGGSVLIRAGQLVVEGGVVRVRRQHRRLGPNGRAYDRGGDGARHRLGGGGAGLRPVAHYRRHGRRRRVRQVDRDGGRARDPRRWPYHQRYLRRGRRGRGRDPRGPALGVR
jgi:filamentous hemagglutinin family protein